MPKRNENVINYRTSKDGCNDCLGMSNSPVEAESEPRPTEGASRGPVPSPMRTHTNQKRSNSRKSLVMHRGGNFETVDPLPNT